LCEKRFHIYTPLDLLLQSGVIIARQPADDFIDFVLRPIFSLRLLNVTDIDLCERHGKDVVHDDPERLT
jgi:hypothetical protein